MPNFIPKKDRRFPIGPLFLIMYIIIGCIGVTVSKALVLYSQGYVMIFAALEAFAWGFVHILSQVAFIAIIVMLFAKVRHFTYAIPGAVGIGIGALGFCGNTLSLIRTLDQFFNLTERLELITWTGYIIRRLLSYGLVAVGELLCAIGWVCFILLAIFSTKRSAKKVNWTLIFVLGAGLIFASSILVNIINSFNTFIYVISIVADFGIRVIIENDSIFSIIILQIGSIIVAGISVVANIFGLAGIIMIGNWLRKPAKRGYVPAAPAEEKAEDMTVKEEAADAEDQENTKAKRERINTLVDFYNA